MLLFIVGLLFVLVGGVFGSLLFPALCAALPSFSLSLSLSLSLSSLSGFIVSLCVSCCSLSCLLPRFGSLLRLSLSLSSLLPHVLAQLQRVRGLHGRAVDS